LQTLLYKEEIEAALRTPDFSGFQLLDLHDFPGQGTALVGLLDAFWDAKPYLTAQAFREFCSETVLLARFDKVTYSQAETLAIRFEIAHFGAQALIDQTLVWTLSKGNSVVKTGEIALEPIPLGSGIPLGEVKISLAEIAAPNHLTFSLQLTGTEVRNHWDFWLYPNQVDLDSDILLARSFDEAVLGQVKQGKSVLLVPETEILKNTIPVGFTTAFWNVAWTAGQAPHTQGILCDPEHPALRYFPTQSHSNWQWWELLQGAKCLITHKLEASPIIQVIDDWRSNRKLALAVEFKMGQGKVLLCTANLMAEPRGLVSRQLLYSLQEYMKSPEFNPLENLTASELNEMLQA
jgi:hypothetical protein